MKKIFNYILIASFVFLPITNVSAFEKTIINSNGIKIDSVQYANLKSQGYSDKDIQSMDEEEFSRNSGLSAQVISADTRYIKTVYTFDAAEFDEHYDENKIGTFSKETLTPKSIEDIEISKKEFDLAVKSNITIKTVTSVTINGELTNDKIIEEYKTLITAIFQMSSNSYRVRTDVVWVKMPFFRDIDILKTSVGSNVIPIDSSKYGKQNWTMCSGSTCQDGNSTYGSGSGRWVDPDFNSRSLSVNIKNDEGAYKVNYIGIYMYYDLSKETTNTVTVLDAYGNYRHRILLGYETTGNTHAQANVRW